MVAKVATVLNSGVQPTISSTGEQATFISNTELFGDTFSSPVARDGPGPYTTVALHPDFPLVLDPGQVIPVGGKTKGGQTMPHAADINGAQILSDAPTQVTGQGFNTTGASILAYFDTQGYQSVSVQLFGTWAGTVTFSTSNDSANWLPVTGWSAGAGGAVTSSTTGNGMWSLPALGRYIKVQITTYTSGTVLCSAFLRNQPVPFLVSNLNTNTAAIGGTAPVTAGVAGLQAIGGNIAQGVLATSNPVPIGGIDVAGKTRRFLTDLTGAQQVAGAAPDVSTTPVVIKSASSVTGEDGMADALNQILRELRYHSHVLQQLPLYLNSGLSQVDEAAQFRDDPSLSLN